VLPALEADTRQQKHKHNGGRDVYDLEPSPFRRRSGFGATKNRRRDGHDKF
jgi:hypothetical protein